MLNLVLYSLFSYITGCISFSYYITKIFTGKNLKEIGSGNLGSLNAARVLGKKGFIIIFLLDFGKGILVVLLARYFDFATEYIFLFMALVTIGHIFPVQLKFKGGKGIAPYTGTIATLNLWLAIPVIGIFVIFYLIFKRFTIPGLISIAFLPVSIYILNYSFLCVLQTILIVIIILFAHRKNIIEFVKNRKSE